MPPAISRNMTSESPDRDVDLTTSYHPKKRAKYTQIACNECKRRKIKCSGGSTCSRCARGKIPCVYPTDRTPIQETEFKDARVGPRFDSMDRQLELLQREMRSISTRLRELEASSPGSSRPAKISTPRELDRILNAPKSPPYVGPTSAEFGLRRQRASSRDPGSDNEADEDMPLSTPTRSPTPEGTASHAGSGFRLGLDDALRLVQVYEDLVGVMYPCVDIDSVRAYVHEYYRSHDTIFTDATDSLDKGSTDQDWFFARDIQVLKLILATALLAESHGRSEAAAQLADSVEDRFASRFKVAEVDMKEILIMTLLSIFHSYRDDEVISWRMTRIATSACMELGLHRQETWQRTGGVFPGELAWTWAMRLFWCIYVLDRKWSFGSGLPFGIQDMDMDTNLPEPGHSTPYLTCMISYARLSTKIWGLVMEWPKHSRLATADKCAELDAQVQQWIWSIPRELRFNPNTQPGSLARPEHSPQNDRAMMLQVLLALQGNQLRILVYRQNLQSSEHIAADVAGATIAVETAKSTIHMLEYFSGVTNIYFQRPEPFNYFLISALAALLLAVLHAPSRFSHVCRPEFYTAIELVRRSATRARTSRRLQKIIRSLKHIQLHKGGPDNQANPHGRPAKPATRGTKRPAEHPAIHADSTPSRGPWDINPLSTPASQPPSNLRPNQNYDTSTTSWQFSTGTMIDEPNICEDLSSFFENAGDLYFDAHAASDLHLPSGPDLSLARGVDMGFFSVPANPQSPTTAFDTFEADNEELTRVMAGLL